MEFVGTQVKLLLDGQPFSGQIHSLKLQDAAAVQPDFLWLELSQTTTASQIELQLKDGQGWFECGFFYPTQTEVDPDGKANIFCTSIQNKHLRTTHNRSFQNIQIADILQTIATQNKMQAVCQSQAQVNYIAQTGETDAAFLERLAGLFGLQVGIKKNKLCLVKYPQKPQHSLNGNQVFNYQTTTTNPFQSCQVHWFDADKNREFNQQIGNQPPVHNLFIGMGKQEQAVQRAQQFLRTQSQNSLTGTFTMNGQELFAGNTFELKNANLDGQLLLAQQVQHTVAPEGWQMQVQFCRA